MNNGLNDEIVMEYLTSKPDFFIRNAAQVEHIRVPHPVRGSVSLIEWQLARQRRQISQLEEEVTQLMEHATANELLFNRLITLVNELIAAESLQAFLNRLHAWAKELGLAGVNLRLFNEKWCLNAPSDFTHLGLSQQKFELLRIQRFGKENHYLGTLNSQEIALLMPDEPYVGSFALTLLGKFGELGVLIFNSRDAQHYQAGQGTHLLDQLRLLLPLLISRWIERR